MRIQGSLLIAGVLALAATEAHAGAIDDLTLVVSIDPLGFDEIHSADLNDSGEVVFAATIGPLTGVFGWTPSGEVVKIAVNTNGFDVAYAPVINDGGQVAFIGSNRDHRLGIFLVDGVAPGTPPALVLDADAPGSAADLIGQLAINDGATADIAYWSACLGGVSSACTGFTQCVGLVDGTTIACADFPAGSLAAPAINDARRTAFLASGPGDLLHLRQADPRGPLETLLTVSLEGGLISAPSINASMEVAFYARDAAGGLVPGIYRVDGGTTPVLVAALPDGGPVSATTTTRPFLNDAGAYAYLATLVNQDGTSVEGIFTDASPETPVVAVGDAMFEDTLAGSLRLYGLNDGGRMLFSGRLGDESGPRVLALATPAGDPPDCPGDLDGDGEVDVPDLIALVLAWDTDDPQADLDGDGVVGVADLVLLILAFGPC